MPSFAHSSSVDTQEQLCANADDAEAGAAKLQITTRVRPGLRA